MKSTAATRRVSIQQLVATYRDRIEEISDERDTGDGFFLYLREGWTLDAGGASCGNFDTLAQVKVAVEGAVKS